MHMFTFARPVVLFLSVAALLLMTVAVHADTITIANTGTPGTPTTTDANYLALDAGTTLLSNPGVLVLGGSVGNALLIPTIDQPPTWNPGSWIGPTDQPVATLPGPAGHYFVYQVSFTISGADSLSTVLISGDFSSDNCMAVIGINGNGVAPGGGSAFPTSACAGSAHAFEIGDTGTTLSPPAGTYWATAAFTTGTNTLQFEVFNNTGAPNPTGLLTLDMTGSASAAGTTPEPSTAGLLIAGIAAVAWLRRRSLRPSA
ncbi:MAG: PEP-CTERM sorting domain-containing protein [Bryobacteraceae bacterium]|jgi:hypothetical protein